MTNEARQIQKNIEAANQRDNARFAKAQRDAVKRAEANQIKNFAVHVRFQFPAWNEKDGYTMVVSARSKKEATRIARREWSDDGTIGSEHGLTWLKATETDDEVDV